MAIDNAWNMYIFRDGKSRVSGSVLITALAEGLARCQHGDIERTKLLDLLLRAGELECALADLESPQAKIPETVTEALAEALVSSVPLRGEKLAERIRRLEISAEVDVAPPEGFAYYALHPLDFVDVVRRAKAAKSLAAVIGIRSIGTTLSAVVQAALRADGVSADRATVRPKGHPYNRETCFTEQQRRWVGEKRSNDAVFLVVDEGPGLSGSSFLSVGDALIAAGVPRASIVFLCSREPDPASLTALNAVSRWPSYRMLCTEPTRHLPAEARHYIAGGIWRANAFAEETDWPASWLQMERLKFLSRDRSLLFKFEGVGRFGEEVYRRAVQVAEAGFGPRPIGRREGFGIYPWLRVRYLSSSDANPAVFNRLAEYCAFRAEEIPAQIVACPDLEAMLRFNVRELFAVELPPDRASLPVERPVIADGRMLPHKWIDSTGALMKIDSASHGDDHFFPGPTDIAWDLAGTIIEWNLAPEAAQVFLKGYERLSGDDVTRRLPNYLLAYSVFRTAYSRMGAAAMKGADEEKRLLRDYLRYQTQAETYLRDAAKKPRPVSATPPITQIQVAGDPAA
jgi:hypothetical protein